MWREVRREASRFSSGVISGKGEEGTPVSGRCSPRVDAHRRLLVLDGDPYPVLPGPAAILYHRHDDRLWKLRSCLITGTLTHVDGEWLFRPVRFIPGMGIGGALSYLRLLVNGRKNTSRYLAVHNLTRPQPAWEEIEQLLTRAQTSLSDGYLDGTA